MNKILIKTVFLDMDGVLTNFKRAVHQAFGQPYCYKTESLLWNFWEDFDKEVSANQVNSICNDLFWVTMPWMHDGKEIVTKVMSKFGLKNIYLLSDPMLKVESMTGKWKWINRELPDFYCQTILMRGQQGQCPKELLAKPDTLLIDDRDSNVESFRKAGGHAILVPRNGNNMREFADVSVEILTLALRKYQISS